MKGTVAPLSNALGQPCHYLPGGVDGIRFSPYPQQPRRVIDAYSVGRRWQGVHEALQKRAAAQNEFYVSTRCRTARARRRTIRSTAISTRLPPSEAASSPWRRGRRVWTRRRMGRSRVGFRYVRGVRCRHHHDWPGSGLRAVPRDVRLAGCGRRVESDGSNVDHVLNDLAAQPDRMEEISRRNATGALLRHDWIYRWKRMFDIAGLRPLDGMKARMTTLEGLAQHAGMCVNER
mgnify:CR=1 FL=1